MKKLLLLNAIALLIILCSCSDKNKIKIINTNFNKEINVSQNLFIEFNHDLVPDSMVGKWDSTEYFKISPSVKGKYMWESPKELVFTPSQNFEPSEDYKLSLLKSIKKNAKNKSLRLPKKELKFHTPYLNLVSSGAYWAFNETNLSEVELRINLDFNYSINPDNLASLLNIIAGNTNCKFRIINTTSSERIDIGINPSIISKSDVNSLKIIINPGLSIEKSAYKTKKKLEQVVTIPSKDKLEITNVSAYFEQGKGCITVLTSQPILTENIKDLITTYPRVSFETTKLINGFEIKGDFLEGESYKITISGLLKGIFNVDLGEDYSETVTFGSPEPYIEFSDKNSIYLSSAGDRNIGVKIVSVSKITVTVFKIFENNLIHYLRDGKQWDYFYDDDDWYDFNLYPMNENYGKEVYSKEINTKNLSRTGNIYLLNLNLSDIEYYEPLKGIYLLKIEASDKKWLQSAQLVSISDIGLVVKQGLNSMQVFANSINTTEPLKNVQINFISSNNQNVLTAATNSEGIAIIDNVESKIKGFQISMITAKAGNDFNYLSFDQTLIDNSKFDVGGKTTEFLDYDVFVYGDRNLYRPGDSVHINAVIRNMKWGLEKEIPIKVKIILPNGKQFLSFKKEAGKQGAASVSFVLPTSAITGTFIAEVYSGNDVLLSSYRFGVEEFMPDRIKVEAKISKTEFQPSEKISLNILATNLFGPPASNRNVEVEMNINKSVFNPKGYDDYIFNVNTENNIYFDNVVNETKTDNEGKAEATFDLPSSTGIGKLSGNLYSTVFDETGRPVNRISTFDIYTQKVFYGIKKMDYWVGTKKPLKISLVAVNKNGTLLKNAVTSIEIVRNYWETVAERQYGRLHYNSQKREQVIYSKKVIVNGNSSFINFTPINSGEYVIKVKGEGNIGYVTQTIFAYGSGDTEYSSFEVSREGEITIESDKEEYSPGETAKILLKSPFEGKIILSIERDGVSEYQVIETKEKAASYDLKLTDDHLPNIYISATSFRKLNDKNTFLTIAHGVKNINVIDQNRKLKVEITSVEKSRSKTKQTIKVKTDPGAEVTIAVVDEGILQLTNFKTPDPFLYFYGKRALEVNSYDIYKFLYPEISNSSSYAGDVSVDLSKRVNPLTNKRVKLLSLWSGCLTANSRGECSFVADLPQFSGAVRIMAVAYKDANFGSADKIMKVADPIVISTGLPRVLSPDDEVEVPVTITNTTAKSLQVKVNIQLSGPLTNTGNNTQTVSIPANQENMVNFSLIASSKIGIAKVKVVVSAPNESFTDETEISVRPAAGLQKVYGSGSVSGGKYISFNPNSGFLPGTSNSKLVISKAPITEFSKNLSYLINYPYGCLEQTVSAAFPQIYLSNLAEVIGKANLSTKYDADDHVQFAVNKVMTLQQYDGSFSYWPGDYNSNVWATIFATHFLIEAKKAGFEVSHDKLNQAITFVKKIVKNKATDIWHFYDGNNKLNYSTVASRETFYGLFVLALIDEENKSIMNYYKANQGLLTNDSKFLLAGAFGISGDMNSYYSIVPKALDVNRSVRATYGSFYSWIRDKAIALYVLVETDPGNKMIPTLSKDLSEELKKDKWLSTQETVFSLLALGKLAKKAAESNITAQIEINNKQAASFKGKDLIIRQNISNSEVKITGAGSGYLYYYYELEGIPSSGIVQEKDNSIMVRRTFYDRFGNILSGNSFAQNDLVVMEVTLKSLIGKEIENVAITDILPACFEIENPRLNSDREMNWIKQRSTPDYLDIRDDRIMWFTSANVIEKKFYYSVRVVSKGKFKMGSIGADAMYNAEYNSYSGSKIITVN